MRTISLVATLLAFAILPTAANAAPKKVQFRFSSTSYAVVEGTPTFSATVLRSGNTRASASVQYATADGTAIAGTDYVATSGTLSFAPGETRKTFTVTIIDNQVAGPASKNLKLGLSGATSSAPGGATIPPGQATATLTIFDNDGPGTIDFGAASYSVVESAGVATITVTRASAANLVESVDYATSDGTATAGSDYTTTTGTLTFNAGEMSKTFQVPITDDNSYEGDETVQLALSNPQNITNPLQPPVLGPNSNGGPVALTIVDDDVPTFTFHQATYSVLENAGNATITVDRGGDTSIPASVDYATSGGTAVAGTDYTTTSGTLDFAAGQTQASFQVPIIDNTTGGEPNKTIGLHLSQSGNEVDTALLSIVDDDPGIPSVQLSNNVYDVGEAAGAAHLTVTLSHASNSAVTVHVATGNPSDTATAGTDYTAVNTDVTIPAGQTSADVPVTIVNDSEPEDDETFKATLSAPSGAVLGAPSQATVTILDDDSAGTLDFSALRYDAQESDGHATITVRRTGGSAGAASVDYFTTDGTAAAPDDYSATSGTITFGDGDTTAKTFEIPIVYDGRSEGDETVSLGLRNFVSDDDPAATKVAVLHIADAGASGPVQFDRASYDVLENAGSATITVTRSGGSLGGPVTVDYATSDGTAHAGSDYTATSGTLTFAAGEASRSFEVPVTNDSVHQGGRSLNLTLSNPGGGTALGGQSTAALNIGDDDPVSSSSKDRTAPKLKLTAKKLQKLAAKKLVLKVRSNEAAKLSVRANLRKGSKLVKVASASKRVRAGRTITIKLKLSRRALGKLRAAIAAKGKAKITFAVTGTDAAGNKATVRRTITVR